MNDNSLRTLEFGRIRQLVLGLAGSAPGKAAIAALHPLTEPSEVRSALYRTTEAVTLLRLLGRQPYHDLPDLGEILPRARVAGLHVEPLELLAVASFIDGATEVARRISHAEQAPRLAHRAGQVQDMTALAAPIRRAVLPGGEIADTASPRLAEIRRALVRLRAQLQSVMETFLRGRDSERLLQDKLVTTRNDRYVLLLKAEHRSAVPGIIHGSSGSGASLFVEPLPAVELNNDIVSLGDDEEREVIRILTDLTGQVGARADALAEAAEILGELDAAQAMAIAAREMDASAPEIAESNADLDLISARHPLLMPKIAERLGITTRIDREPVPVSLRVGFGSPVLVISGPNTGGKTVALKTVGLLVLMAQSGLHIPAAPGSVLPIFKRVFADIGDDQSIAANLSTFSAHLANIVSMTHDLEAPALVLLDEVGAGTDPTEGGALGVAIVDHFRTGGAMVVATTHHGLMKSYAQSTPGVACASFGYDPETYAPTYRLLQGAPGRSLALEMAERLGLPLSAVRDARSRLDQKQAQAEALLKKLESDRAALSRDQAAFEDARLELASAQARQRLQEQQLETRRLTEVQAFKRDLQRRGEEAARLAADAIRQAVQKLEASSQQVRRVTPAAAARARSEAVTAIREVQQQALAEIDDTPPEPELPEQAVCVGNRVRVRALGGVIGEVLSLGADGGVELAVSGKRLRVPRAEVVALGGGPVGRAPHATAGRSSVAPARPGPAAAPGAAAEVNVRAERSEARRRSGGGAEGDGASINVVGLTVDEALPRVDKGLDDAVRSDRQQVRIVHGFGHGILRRAVADLLRGHPSVASFRAGEASEGGGGVTVAELRD